MFNFLIDTSRSKYNNPEERGLNSVEPRTTIVYNDVLWVFIMPV